jgi:hypothetical protein
MTPSIELDRRRFDAQLRDLLRFGASLGRDFLTPQMRLLLEKIIAFTPPKTTAQGGAAVRRDLNRALQPFAVDEFRAPSLKKIVEKRDYDAFAAFAVRSGNPALVGAKAAPFNPLLHTSRRDRRGRVTGRGLPTYVLGRADRGALRKYLKRKVSHVGIAASGWLAALHLLGGRESAWVERHGTRFGAVIDDRANPTRPGVTAINRTPWASRRDEGQRIIASAMRSRVAPMRTFLRKQVELAAQKIGLAA